MQPPGPAFRIAIACLVAACGDRAALVPPSPTDLSVFDIERPVAATAYPSNAPVRRAAPQVAVGDAPPQKGEPSASSTYSGWAMTNALDGDEQTSWYSGQDDSVAKGKTPFFQVTFPEPRALLRVSVLGNRDPSYFDGFGVVRAQLDVFDAPGRLLVTLRRDGQGDRRDFVFELGGLEGAKAVRFTSLADEGSKNRWGDIAIGEFRVE